MKHFRIIIFLFALIFSDANCFSQEISMSPLFGDGMVLQREKPISVFGEAPANKKITVLFRDQYKQIVADENGKWKIELDSEVYGGPNSLTVKTKNETLEIKDVYVGEVWICSGQSNMEMPLLGNWAHVNNAEEEVAHADHPNIHLFMVDRNTSFQPETKMESKGWKTCTPESCKEFSAVAYFFGRDLDESLDMPIGLIQTAWGGTVAEAWTSAKTLKNIADFREKVLQIEKNPTSKKELELKYKKDLAAFIQETGEADKGINGKDTIFASVDLNDADWMPMDLPGMVESTKIGSVDGSIWFRKTISISDENANKEMILHIAAPDDADETWFNGVKVGESTEWDVPRQYKLASNLAKPGKNVIAIRLSDYRGAGGFMGEASHFALTSEDGFRMELAKNWKCKVGYNLKDIKTIPIELNDPNQPAVLFNAMINPLIPYSFRGVIWYQGESNAGRAKQYEELFPAMINDWRSKWGGEDFPFGFVQLASYLKRNTEPVNDSWAELREAQRLTLKLPNTGMAAAIDIGDAKNIHPGNKQDIGKRLALWARNKVYGENIPYCGPVYKAMHIESSSLIIEFENCYEGLATSDNREVTGFAVAGKDGVYHWAKAKIEGNKLKLTSDQVTEPVSVRYAWSSNPDCNLINAAKLPAGPFEAKL
ncbi:MAG: hypothetical protein JXR82_10080 [Marinifilaceae bacterium]|nr:hypothetical protein [Marinifilaceae bacterium]